MDKNLDSAAKKLQGFSDEMDKMADYLWDYAETSGSDEVSDLSHKLTKSAYIVGNIANALKDVKNKSKKSSMSARIIDISKKIGDR